MNINKVSRDFEDIGGGLGPPVTTHMESEVKMPYTSKIDEDLN